ncbi:Regulatory protein RecX [Andreprevotia sp. IGB-42]|uniref:recombination regulator RecX n=1 Tax=Andreprevotia sp. IGB-42 TaxID=2497473 RepID=UPI00135770A2|nr:recombination regulator RecX [Andreprevotia sp. IGB-42]KAF0814930.1 Regulatory protein RecX [Andreprevotia sp. IGB-42]
MSPLRSKGLQFLNRREYSRSELRQKLAARAEDEAALEGLDALLDDFEARGWLSDRRFAEQWVSSRASRFGASRLRAELRQKGVADELIAEALGEAGDNELARARAVWQKRYPHPPQDLNERGKQLRYLAARGFSLDVIYRVVGGEAPEID